MSKGQLILKCLFGVFNFFQKINENKSTWVIIVVKSNSFVRFFGRNIGLKKWFWLGLTFRSSDLIFSAWVCCDNWKLLIVPGVQFWIEDLFQVLWRLSCWVLLSGCIEICCFRSVTLDQLVLIATYNSAHLNDKNEF